MSEKISLDSSEFNIYSINDLFLGYRSFLYGYG